jgi:hypothetical protein
VLKPGGHVLAFGGTRTVHRLACAIEDAGFEIRDQISPCERVERNAVRTDPGLGEAAHNGTAGLSALPMAWRRMVKSPDVLPSLRREVLRGFQADWAKHGSPGSGGMVDLQAEAQLPARSIGDSANAAWMGWCHLTVLASTGMTPSSRDTMRCPPELLNRRRARTPTSDLPHRRSPTLKLSDSIAARHAYRGVAELAWIISLTSHRRTRHHTWNFGRTIAATRARSMGAV